MVRRLQKSFFCCCLSFFILSTSHVAAEKEVQDLRIATMCSLSGDYAVVGQGVCNGIILAKEEYNKKHDANVELIIEDDAFKAQKAISAFQALELKGFDGLISCSSIAVNTLRHRYQKLPHPVVSLFIEGQEPEADNIFQIVPSVQDAQRALGKSLAEKGYKNPVVVYSLNDTLVRFVNAIEEGYGKKLEKVEVPAGENDFRPLVAAALKHSPDVIVFSVFPAHGALFLKHFPVGERENIHFAFDGNFQSGVNDYKEILGDLNFLSSSTLLSFETNRAQGFEEKYEKRFGEKAPAYAEYGYDAFTAFIRSYDSNTEKWFEKIQNLEFTGASGDISFDEKGLYQSQYSIIQVGDYL